MVVASTSEVYGKANGLPFSEKGDLVFGPTSKSRWSYACSKAIDEFLALACWKERRVPVVIARLFNIVGPRQTGRYGMVVPNLVKQALEVFNVGSDQEISIVDLACRTSRRSVPSSAMSQQWTSTGYLTRL